LQENITLVGSKVNPFPHIKAADLLMLCTYFEAAPMVFGEAMTLGVPVLTTNTVSAADLISDKGFVCGNNEKGIYVCIAEILSNAEQVAGKKDSIANYCYPNDEIKEKFLELCGK